MTLDSALRYATLGYPVLPIRTGAKTPLTAHGLKDATVDADQITAWWTSTPDANVAIECTGLLVVDIDPDGADWLKDEPDKRLELATAPTVKTPRGKHHYFRRPAAASFGNAIGKIAKGVDVKTNGGYVLAPGSIVGGVAYEWIEALDCEADRLPLPPAWLLAMLDGSNKPQSAAAGNLTGFDANQHGPDAPIHEGGRDDTLFRMASALRRNGLSPDAILAALREENQLRCKPPLDDASVVKCANSGAKYKPDAVAVAAIDGPDAGEPLETGPVDPGPMADSLCYVPGYVDSIVEWNLAESFKPQPVLALAGALCLLSTLTGRKIRDSVNTRTNLYCIAVGETGCGKERAREVNGKILRGAGLDEMIGPEAIASASGLISAVEQHPAILFQLDEIGRMLKTLGNAQQNPHLYNIATVLLKLFTSSNKFYKADAYADVKKNKILEQPHAVVLGTTVAESLYAGMTEESLSDGFLNRMLLFEARESERRTFVEGDVPKKLVDEARWWGDFKPGGNLAGQNPQPIVVPTTAAVEATMTDLASLADAERKRLGNPLGALWQRAEEKARKLALLWACSENRQSPHLSKAGALWSKSLIEYNIRRTIHLASRWVSAGPNDAKRKAILRTIESAGPAGASKTMLNNRLGNVPARERNELINDLLQCRLIVETVERTATNKSTRFVASKFMPAISA